MSTSPPTTKRGSTRERRERRRDRGSNVKRMAIGQASAPQRTTHSCQGRLTPGRGNQCTRPLTRGNTAIHTRRVPPRARRRAFSYPCRMCDVCCRVGRCRCPLKGRLPSASPLDNARRCGPYYRPRKLNAMRRLGSSTCNTRTRTSFPTQTISSGSWNGSELISERWIRPSTPSSSRTNAPKEAT